MAKITRIGYQHSFQVTQFLYDKIYFEAELEPNETEEQVVSQLIQKCKEVAKRVHDGVNVVQFESLPEWLKEKVTPKEEPVKKVRLIDINFSYDEFLACILYSESVKELEECETGIGKGKNITDEEKRKLWLAYDEQYAKLQKQTV